MRLNFKPLLEIEPKFENNFFHCFWFLSFAKSSHVFRDSLILDLSCFHFATQHCPFWSGDVSIWRMTFFENPRPISVEKIAQATSSWFVMDSSFAFSISYRPHQLCFPWLHWLGMKVLKNLRGWVSSRLWKSVLS